MQIEKGELEKVEKETQSIIEQVNNLAITSIEDYTVAMSLAVKIKTSIKKIQADFFDMVDKAHKSWKAAIATRDQYITPREEVLAVLDQKTKSYRATLEIIRAEEARQRLLAEEKEKNRLAALAEKARDRGDEKKAEEFEARKEEIEVTPPPAVTAAFPKVEGARISKIWKAQVLDMTAFIKGINDGIIPIVMVEPNEKGLKQTAVATKGTLKWPGVRFYSEDSSL